MNTPEQSIGDLAIGLGMWMASGFGANVKQQECFIESVLVLAYKAGVDREVALQPFDLHQQLANRVWRELENDK